MARHETEVAADLIDGEKKQKQIKKLTSAHLEAELAEGGFFGKNCTWITYSLLAGLCMGTGSAIFATNYADLGYEGGGLTGPGVFLIFLFILVIRETVHKCKTGSWVKAGDESRLLWANGNVKWSNLVPLLGNATVNVSYLIVMTYAWYFARLGEINQGVVSALLALASLINVVSFYFGFGEKIGWLHLIGVIFMVASVICIGAAAGSHSGEVETDEELEGDGGLSIAMNGFLAILCGLGGPTVVSTQHFLIRKYKPQYNGISQALDAAVIEFFVLTLFLIPLSNTDFTITWTDLAIGAGAGLLMCMGRVFVTIGVAIGLAGPAEALMSTHALYQSLISAIFAGQTLSVIEILGVLLGLAGVFFMAFLDTCVDKCQKRREIRRLKAEEALELAKTSPQAENNQDKNFFYGQQKD